MQINFRTSDKGFGLFLDINIEIFTDTIVGEKIDTDIYFTFEDSVAKGFEPGFYFLKKAILDNIRQVKNAIKHPAVIKLISVDSNPAHYQDEAFYGATILWLNQLYNMNIKTPIYLYETANKRFKIMTS